MPQLDKELFIDYIFYILLILVHLYTGFQINKNLIRLNGRFFLIDNFLNNEFFFKKQSTLVKKILTNTLKTKRL